ncbi:MAG TPA: glycosyltransferase [Anaerolineales bacterium]|jgi:glycosyltransferase involved in cell wall biosynthesis
MNILYLCADPGIPVRGHKGAAIHVRALSDALCSLGHSVSILTPRAGPADGAETQARLVEVAAVAAPAEAGAAEREQAALATSQEVYRAARQLLEEEKFELIYERYSLWSDAGAQLAHETGLPLVLEVNAPLRQEAARYRSLANTRLAKQIETRLIKSAAVLAVVSEPIKDYLLERGAAPQKIRVIPNAVDESIFHPAVDGSEVRSRLGLADKFVIGFAGTSRPWHDLETLVAAVARLRSAPPALLRNGEPGAYHLLLVGEFSEAVRESLEAHNLQGMVTLAGPFDHREVPAYLAAMDVAVSPHPDMADFYFSPLKLFEYQACGVPTVAADVAPVAAVITHGQNGLLYAPGEVDELVEQITTLAANPRQREALGLQGARHVLQHYTWRNNARTITALGAQATGIMDGTPALPLVGEKQPLWDEKMGRALYHATRLDLLNESLSKNIASMSKDGLWKITGWQMLKYKNGRRCVLAYEAGSQKAAIGKVFSDERGREYFNLQRALWLDGFNPASSDRITVAVPLAYLPEMQMFLQEYAPGQSLDQSVDAPGLEEKVRSSAAAIAKLHGSAVEPRKTYPLGAELDNLEQWMDELCGLRPDLAPTFEKLWEQLFVVGNELTPAALLPVHRDYYYGQVLFSESRLTLIDLDLLAWGEAEIDVANFAAHLQFLAMQLRADPHAFDPLAEIFIREYMELRPLAVDPRKVAFYEAATFYRLMCVALTRPQFSGYFENLLELCQQKNRKMLEKIRA